MPNTVNNAMPYNLNFKLFLGKCLKNSFWNILYFWLGVLLICSLSF